jgi:hypothetical protein
VNNINPCGVAYKSGMREGDAFHGAYTAHRNAYSDASRVHARATAVDGVACGDILHVQNARTGCPTAQSGDRTLAVTAHRAARHAVRRAALRDAVLRARWRDLIARPIFFIVGC